MAVEAGVDLTAIEELGQVFKWVDLALSKVGRVHDSFPVLVGETRRSNKNIHNPFNDLERYLNLWR